MPDTASPPPAPGPEPEPYLSRTGGRILVEASPVDRIWGIDLAATSSGSR